LVCRGHRDASGVLRDAALGGGGALDAAPGTRIGRGGIFQRTAKGLIADGSPLNVATGAMALAFSCNLIGPSNFFGSRTARKHAEMWAGNVD